MRVGTTDLHGTGNFWYVKNEMLARGGVVMQLVKTQTLVNRALGI
jgi:hypothetical protein